MTRSVSVEMAGFEVQNTGNILGVEHTALVHEYGSTVLMPTERLAMMPDLPEQAEIVGRVAAFAAGHDGYRGAPDVEQAHHFNVIQQSRFSFMERGQRPSSVYAAPVTPTVIIKAFDYDSPRIPAVQYAALAAIEKALWHSDPEGTIPLGVPQQIALVQSPRRNHRTVLMTKAQGINLHNAVDPFRTQQHAAVTEQQEKDIRDALLAALEQQVPPGLRAHVGAIEERLDKVWVQLKPESPSAVPQCASDIGARIVSATLLYQPRFGSFIGLRSRGTAAQTECLLSVAA